MPDPRERDPSLTAPITGRPLCGGCGKQMELDRIEPHARFINTMVRIFYCECGAVSSDVFTLKS
jgi:hypothetical protein